MAGSLPHLRHPPPQPSCLPVAAVALDDDADDDRAVCAGQQRQRSSPVLNDKVLKPPYRLRPSSAAAEGLGVPDAHGCARGQRDVLVVAEGALEDGAVEGLPLHSRQDPFKDPPVPPARTTMQESQAAAEQESDTADASCSQHTLRLHNEGHHQTVQRGHRQDMIIHGRKKREGRYSIPGKTGLSMATDSLFPAPPVSTALVPEVGPRPRRDNSLEPLPQRRLPRAQALRFLMMATAVRQPLRHSSVSRCRCFCSRGLKTPRLQLLLLLTMMRVRMSRTVAP